MTAAELSRSDRTELEESELRVFECMLFENLWSKSDRRLTVARRAERAAKLRASKRVIVR